MLGAACGGGSDDAAPSAPPSAESPTSIDAPAPSQSDPVAPAGDAPEILQFSNALVGGGELDAAELANTPTAFWFWAPT